MKKIKKILTATAFAVSLIPSFAFANLYGVKGTMRNVESAIEEVIKQSEFLYEQNGGTPMPHALDTLKNGDNPYIDKLIIDTDYKVLFKFASSKKQTLTYDQAAVPVTSALLGKEIILVPMHNAGDAKISSWECLTNADRNVRMFAGSRGTKELTASFIRRNTTNPYLSMCIYANINIE